MTCTCTMAQKLVGDGCYKCNPEIHIDHLNDELAEVRQQRDELFEALSEQLAKIAGLEAELAKVDKLAASPKINKTLVYGRFFEKYREELLSGLNARTVYAGNIEAMKGE